MDRVEQRRASEILDAAEQVFFCKGFNQASMDEIARQAGMSRALLYVYFRDKSAIMRGIMLRAARMLTQCLEEAVNPADEGLQQIHSIGKAYFRFSIEQSDYFDVLTDLNTFPRPSEEGDEQMRELACCRNRSTAAMVAVLEGGVRDGSICPEMVKDPVRTAFMLQGALHGVIMQTRGPRYWKAAPGAFPYPDSDALVDHVLAMMGEAMRNHEQQESGEWR